MISKKPAPSNTDCPFCSPNVLESCFAESRNYRAVYNIAPILPGHSLIVPIEHTSSFIDLDDESMLELVQFSRKVVKTLQKAFSTLSFDWTIQDGVPAGQTVDHFHLHIIPRKPNDLSNPGDWYPNLVKNETEMLDSFSRAKHTSNEIIRITSYLSKLFRTS